MGGAGPRLTASLLVFVIGAWLLIDVVLNLRLTQVLSSAISVTGAEWIMYLLIGLSVLSVGVTIERWLFYRGRIVDVEALRTQVASLLAKGDSEDAVALATTLPAMEGRALAACLGCLDQGPQAMERQLAVTLAHERLRYERYLIILGTLGNSAPFIGLFGTVLGIIKAFMDLAADIAGGAAVVMAGISEALVATALGLLVAIPSVIAYNALKAKVRSIGANSEYLAHVVIAHAEGPHGDGME
jgi:biopolymer transport protein ExbB